jgi:hypothetical protein
VFEDKKIQEFNREAIKPHPVVGIVCKEIPILKLLLELLVDFFRVLIQILGQTWKYEGQTQRLTTG